MKKYYVYCHILKKDGRKYIGITSQKPKNRWNNGFGYKDQPYFYRAINKYGWDNFEHKIVLFVPSKKMCELIEIILIFLLRTRNHKYGFNCTSGGNGVHNLNEESKQILISKLKNRSEPNWRSKKVICLETKKIYKNIMEAGKDVGVSFQNIQKVCARKYGYKTAKGYHWQYYDDDVDYDNNSFIGSYKKDIYSTPIICLENGKIYRSQREASRELGIPQPNIYKQIVGLRNHTHNYHFKYLEGEENNVIRK